MCPPVQSVSHPLQCCQHSPGGNTVRCQHDTVTFPALQHSQSDPLIQKCPCRIPAWQMAFHSFLFALMSGRERLFVEREGRRRLTYRMTECCPNGQLVCDKTFSMRDSWRTITVKSFYPDPLWEYCQLMLSFMLLFSCFSFNCILLFNSFMQHFYSKLVLVQFDIILCFFYIYILFIQLWVYIQSKIPIRIIKSQTKFMIFPWDSASYQSNVNVSTFCPSKGHKI